MKETVEFREDKIFLYERWAKIGFGIGVIFFSALFISLIISYFFLKDSDIAFFRVMNSFISHIVINISASSVAGIFYTTFFGGLFFITIPIEVFFVKYLSAGYAFYNVIFIYFIGIAVSYTIDYLIGLKLSRLSKKLISPKKFYKLKGLLNKWGSLAVLLFNATPLPSQHLSVILGVFRYNKTRFYVFVFLGQLIKYSYITAGYYFL